MFLEASIETSNNKQRISFLESVCLDTPCSEHAGLLDQRVNLSPKTYPRGRHRPICSRG